MAKKEDLTPSMTPSEPTAPVALSSAPAEKRPFDPDTWEFKTIEDFDIYNRWARNNKRRVRIPTEEFWPKVEVKFQRFDQPENVAKICVRNKDIDWKGQLKPGKTYFLPTPVVKFLNKLSEPLYGEVPLNDGTRATETKQIGEKSRFSCQVINF